MYSFKFRDNFLLYTNILDDKVSIILSIYFLSSLSLISYVRIYNIKTYTLNSSKAGNNSFLSNTPSLGSLSAASNGYMNEL